MKEYIRKFLYRLRWLLPKIEARKWIILIILCVALMTYEFIMFGIKKLSVFGLLVYLIPTISLFVYAYIRLIKSMYDIYRDCRSGEIRNFYPSRHFEFSPKIIVIGGGTGLSTLLRGIKNYGRIYDEQNVTAIVSVMDDGGSSGKLREELNILPPGDIRNCLVSLANEETLMSELFNYRFKGEGGLSGHSFGNLLIAALTGITGDFDTAVEESSKILAVKGKILPATMSMHMLKAKLLDGQVVEGESSIGKTQGKNIKKLYLDPYKARVNKKVLEAISEADCIIFGPGSLFTSIIPNLLVDDIREVIKQSNAIKVYVCNIMTQPNETDGFSASDHIKTLFKYMGGNFLDFVLLNSREGSPEILKKYAEKGAFPVKVDKKNIKELDVNIVYDDLMEESNYLRHDFKNLARLIINLTVNHNYEKK